jgi:hypothetical protein
MKKFNRVIAMLLVLVSLASVFSTVAGATNARGRISALTGIKGIF